jgi:serine/threonine-protein kinase
LPDSLAQLQSALADRYTIERELGAGGMATVYLAEDLRHNRKVAVKVLRPELAASLGTERFLREIRTTAQLTHPHILPLHDSGDAGGFLYYTMPFVEGESLRDRLSREKQLPLDDALQIVIEVADALAYAHAHAVMHRDIKPENILLQGGHAVVADFGIAKAIAAAGSERLTETGLAVGTPQYMSPEQASGEADLDGRSDLYSLGCVLYEMLAGEPPFTGRSAQAVVAKRLSTPAPRISILRDRVPAHVEEALDTALARAPADRFATTSQFAEALRGGTTSSGVPVLMATRPRRIAAAVASLLILSAAGWLGVRLLRPPAASASLAHRPFTIVAELDGTAPADVRAAAHNLIISSLDESGVLASLPDEQIKQGLSLAGKPETTRLTLTTARELAVRGGIRTVVAGTVDEVGQTYHVAVRVLDADSGVVVAAKSDVARGKDDLIPTLDSVVRAVRGDLGEHRAAIAANRPLDQVATPSFAAYQRLRRANELILAGENGAATAALKDALALDPDFAVAWIVLSVALYHRGSTDSAAAALDEALARPKRMTEQQRLSASGMREIALGNYSAALAAEEQLHRLYGGDPSNLTVVLGELGREAETVALYEEYERTAPFGLNAIHQFNLVGALLPLGRLDEARRRADSTPGNWGVGARLMVATWTADWFAAESLATRISDQRSLASVAAARGRVRDAIGMLRTCSCQLRQLVLQFVSGSPVTRAQVGALPLADHFDGGQLLAALWAAAAGDTGAARRILTRVRSLPPERRDGLDAMAVLVEAWLAAAAGRPADVVQLLRPLADRGTPLGPPVMQPVRWSLAAAYEHQGQLDSAAAQLERLAAWQGASEKEDSRRGFTHSFAHQRLVLLYARLGRPDDARRHWKIFSETFTNPDPELRHLVDEARAALASAERRS